MPDIILPRRIGGPASRGRPVRAPTAADVPRAGLVSDPGLNVNEKQFGDSSGLEALGQAVSDTGKIIDAEVKRQQKTDAEVERQQKLVDATESGKRRSQFSRHAGDQLTRAVTEGDFTQEVERDLYTTFLDNLKVESLRGLEGGEAQKISPDARARLETSLDDMSSIFRSRAAKLHLNAVQQLGIDQLAVSRNAGANRVHVDPDSLEAELDLLEMSVAEFSGSFIANQERDALSKGREAYIESAVLGLVKQGRAEEAQALLQNEEIAGHLDEATRAGLKKNTEALAHAHDRDLIERGKRGIAEEATAREGAALAFTIDFRPRLKTGEATLAEIATAETGGILTPARADRLRSDLADDQNRRETIAARAEKVTSALQTEGRLNPEDFDDHDDVGHHYEATLKTSLAGLDPAQKASAISGYVADTGIAPDAALKTLLGLTATGDASNRIAAARELFAVFDTDPTARDKVPPGLAAHAETLVQLANTESMRPDEVVNAAEALFKTLVLSGTDVGTRNRTARAASKDIQVAMGPIAAALPALGVTTETLSAAGITVLSVLGIASMLGLKGDAMQGDEEENGKDDEDKDKTEDGTNPLDLPIQPVVPQQPNNTDPPDFPPTTAQKQDDDRSRPESSTDSQNEKTDADKEATKDERPRIDFPDQPASPEPPNQSMPPEFPPAVEQIQDDNGERPANATEGKSKEHSLEISEQVSRAEGQKIQKNLVSALRVMSRKSVK